MDEHFLNDLLECSVCLDRLDTSSKVLPCQHTFCRKCLEVIVKSRKELRCPECRVLVNVRIDDLPPNVLLMRILEGMKNATTLKTHDKTKQKDGDGNIKEQEKQNKEENVGAKHQNTHLHKENGHQSTSVKSSHQPQSDNRGGSMQYQRRCILPHAYALYDYIAKESNDFYFKKGDLVLLKRKIDTNWYFGQSNGVEGCFPINYVNVIVPLPVAQCKALYDFKMGPNEEEGCLSFTKGTIIHVIRRIDANWAEGRIGATVGIFPIAFVELNNIALQMLLENNARLESVNNNPSVKSETASKNSTEEYSNSTQHAMLQLNMPPLPNSKKPDILRAQNDINSANSSAPAPEKSMHGANYTTLNNVKPFTVPAQTLQTNTHLIKNITINAPNCASGNNLVRLRDVKRHSLNAQISGTIPTNNHTSSSGSVLSKRNSAEILCLQNEKKEMFVPNANAIPTGENNDNVRTSSYSGANVNEQTINPHINKTNANQTNVTQLPWGYLALYSYKPRKSDELELTKGCVYIVTERCLDGWFKGKNFQSVSGVFPGNYLMPLSSNDQKHLFTQWKSIQKSDSNMPYNLLSHSQVQHTFNNMLPNIDSKDTQNPPDIPARTDDLYWCSSSGQLSNIYVNKNCITHTPNFEQKSKDVGSLVGGFRHAKHIANISGREKSPNKNGTNDAENLSPEQSDMCFRNEPVKQLTPIHIRSGSCPSQILQNKPMENQNLDQYSAFINQQQNVYHFDMHASQKLNVSRDRQLSGHVGMDGSTFGNVTNNGSTDQVSPGRSAVLTNPDHETKLINNQISNQNIAQVFHRKSQSLDASNILNVGDVYKISEAAIKASATTKSLQPSHESRFRCIVPYPPNSDIELELHIGDIIYVQRKQKNGWYKGTHARTNKTGLFPASFVEPDF